MGLGCLGLAVLEDKTASHMQSKLTLDEAREEQIKIEPTMGLLMLAYFSKLFSQRIPVGHTAVYLLPLNSSNIITVNGIMWAVRNTQVNKDMVVYSQ